MSLLLGLALTCVPQGGPPPWEPPVLVPPARVVQPRYSPWAVPVEARVVATQPELEAIAGVLAEELSKRMGVEVPAVSGTAKSGDFVLSTGGTYVEGLPTDEGFAIEVYGDHLAVMGKGPEGVARGAARMLQLGDYDPEDKATVFPAVYVQDWPELGWRGLSTVDPRTVESDGANPSDPVLDAIDDAFLLGFDRVVHPGERLDPASASDPALAARIAGYLAYAEARSIVLSNIRSFLADPRVVMWSCQPTDLPRPPPRADAKLIHWLRASLFAPIFFDDRVDFDIGPEIEECRSALRGLKLKASGVQYEEGARLPASATEAQLVSYQTKLATYAWTGALPPEPESVEAESNGDGNKSEPKAGDR